MDWRVLPLLCLLCGCGASNQSEEVDNAAASSKLASAHLVQSEPAQEPTKPVALSRAEYFANGDHNETLLGAVQEGMKAKVNFAGKFSTSYVDCGVGCGSYWLVDRRSGAVFESPDEAADEQMIWDIATRAGSDRLRIIYGSRDGIGDQCEAQEFRWSGQEFSKVAEKVPAACPQ